MQQVLKTKQNLYQELVNNLLLNVQKPGQYLGIEWGHLVQGELWSSTKVRAALIYPDLYELGMSNFGTKILYQIINNHPDFLCDRAYAPMKDMEELLRKEKVSLWGWESFKPLASFDLLGFSLSYELSYTNVLNILELSNLKVLSKEREEIFPLIFAGGPSTFNPEPMADFIDFFIIGDGEEVIVEVLNLIKEFKDAQGRKDDLLLKLAQIPGIYVPKFYKPDPNDNYLPKRITGLVLEKITKRVVSLNDYNQPVSGPVPYLASVQDRQVLEIRRGCDRGCRFCQPGYVYLPVRERTPQNLLALSETALKNTGYDEYSLLSLSASDYTCLHELATTLNSCHSPKGISLSMPSQRADRFDMKIANELNTVRKSGITLAPEAGTERLREVINKGLKEEDIKRAIENVYDSGFHRVKLYFMIGLPTETYEDLDGIIKLLSWAYNLSKVKNKKPLDITCTISTFVPKAFTPFQWFSQNKREEFSQKISYLKQKVRELKLKTVRLNCTNPNIALLEVILSRGDRRMSKLIHKAFKNGAIFDAWDECLNITTWENAAKEITLDLDYEATKFREIGSVCPWDIIDTGLLNKFLIHEWNKAVLVKETPACTENKCHACGVCFELDVLNEVTFDRSKNNKFVKTIPRHCEEEQSSDEAISLHDSVERRDFSLPVKTIQKVEIVHSKTGNLRFISHLDVQRLFERALRRAEIKVAFTEGFNPRPKMKWLMPLPLFYESNHELMHLELSENVKNSELHVILNKEFPWEFQVKPVNFIDLTQSLPKIENIKVLYRILALKPYLWEKYTCEIKSSLESFLAQESVIQKVLKGSRELNKKDKQKEKFLNVRGFVKEIKIKNESPFELEMILLGNARVETILNLITPKEIQEEFTNNGRSSWQMIWKITKDLVWV